MACTLAVSQSDPQTCSQWPQRCINCRDKERCPVQQLAVENEVLKEEIRVSRESAEITASLVVKQFEETERVLRRFQVANAQRKAVLDSASQMAVMATDNTGLIIVFNKGAENLLGYAAQAVIGSQNPLLFLQTDELEARAEALLAETGRYAEGIDVFFHYVRLGWDEPLEWTFVRQDGSQFPVSMTINALRDAEGAISGLLCIATDVTEKKRSEQALRESERNYRLLINTIPNIVFKGYPDGSIDFFDDKIEQLTGYPRELFLSRRLKWTDLIADEDRAMARERYLGALKGDKQYIREYRIRKSTGELVWVQASSQIVCDEKGSPSFVSGAFLDISVRKKAEEALHDSEEKYRSLFESGPNPIFVLELSTLQILDVNPAAIDAYSYSKEELLGRYFGELGDFEIDEQTLDGGADVKWPESCFISQKARHRKKDGTPFYIRVKACPIKYKSRQALIVAATDITEAIEKDAQLFQSSKMKTLGEMSAGIAHELTQPLNAIKIGNDYLKRKIQQGMPVSAGDLDRVATAVTSQVERASEIINRLREFGRKPDFKKEPVNLNAVVTHVMQIIGQQLVLNNIRVVYDLDPKLPHILANQNRLEQVIFNLVSNARDAIEQLPAADAGTRTREIKLQTCTDSGEIVCAVADTGIGIAEDAVDKIFEPFFTTKEVGKGMGLGLAISYGIVRDYGGRIEVKSKEVQGTRIELRFAPT
jgi:PAS domain S-box-containing protein